MLTVVSCLLVLAGIGVIVLGLFDGPPELIGVGVLVALLAGLGAAIGGGAVPQLTVLTSAVPSLLSGGISWMTRVMNERQKRER